MEPTIRCRELSKRFGSSVVFQGLDFDAGPGEIVGIFGPNGVGKSTFLQCICGLENPNSGSVTILGRAPEDSAIRRLLGVSSQQLDLPELITPAEAVQLFSAMYGVHHRVDVLLAEFDLTAFQRQPLRTLSVGQQQQVSLCLALMHDPQVAILDEPAAALDTDTRQKLYARLRAVRDRGGTVLISSHDECDNKALCDRIAELRAGALAWRPHESRAPSHAIQISATPGIPIGVLKRLPGVTQGWADEASVWLLSADYQKTVQGLAQVAGGCQRLDVRCQPAHEVATPCLMP